MKRNPRVVCLFILLFSVFPALATGQVVVVPLGGAPGDAGPEDVVQGRTFSSRAGKGMAGTLELPPNARSFTNSNGMTFHLIPAGTFIMGSPDGTGTEPAEPGRDTDEIQHQVTLSKSFYLQITEVTQGQWQAVIGNNPAASNIGAEYPLEMVNWYEAVWFANVLSQQEGRGECYVLSGCSSTPGNNMQCTGVDFNPGCTGYRLPTEAEWEYAARGGTTTAYANPYSFDDGNTEIWSGFNSNLAAVGWYAWNRTVSGYGDGTKPVAQKQANPWGLYDMHGNLWEMCQDWYDAYPAGPVTDPQGPALGNYRVVRGGSWPLVAVYERSACRSFNPLGSRDNRKGFRLALTSGQ